MLNTKEARRHLTKDPKMRPLIQALQPLELPPSGNVFNELVKAIVYQQISYKAADSIYGRFVGLMGSEEYSPTALDNIKFEQLRSVGFSGQKANYAKNIADYFEEKKLFDRDWNDDCDDMILNLLTEIKGVGKWTVEMILMFQLNRPDIFPVGDLAIRQSMASIYKLEEQKKALISKLNEIAESWRPHRTLASLYLWSWKRANP